MDLQIFQDRIKSTPIFNDEQKEHFLSRVESYTPELRDKLVKILEEHEDNLLKYGEEKKKEASCALHEKMRSLETLHAAERKKEIEEAEETLLKDLKNI